ncbi:MAG: GEVED domain-containing protein, partial [Salibacteraceae bacterium]
MEQFQPSLFILKLLLLGLSFSFSKAKAQYCAPIFGTGCAVGDQIQNFSTTGGTTNITNNGSGCSAGNYGDFTAMSHTAYPAQTVNVSVQSGPTYQQGFAIWVDWNNNNVFEASEQVWNSGTAGFNVFTGGFYVPYGTTPGAKRMRVRANFNALPTDPCANQTWGEVEDYTLNVIASPCVLPTIPATFNANLADRLHTFTNVNLAGTGSNSVYVDPGQNFSISFNYSIANGGPYCPGCVTQSYIGIKDEWAICLRSYGGYCNCSGSYANTITAPTTPGVYYFTVGTSFLFACSANPNAHIPASTNGFAAIVVRETYSVTTIDETCVGDNDGAINVTPDFSTPNNSYLWSTGEITNSLTGLGPGVRTLISTDLAGCYQFDTIEVSTDTDPPLAAAHKNHSLLLNNAGAASITLATIDSASSDDCSFTTEIGRSVLTSNEDDYEWLGNHNGHSYFISKNTASWPAALAAAQSVGGDLVAVNNAAENTFLTGVLQFPSWTGFNDIAVEGTFVWSNGDPVTYTNWNVGEPNNAGNEDCAIYSPALLWNDAPCAATARYIVEVEQELIFGASVGYTCTDTGQNVVILKATDQGGLTSYDIAYVEVSDLISPNLNTINQTIYLDSNGVANISADTFDNSSTDNCGIDSFAVTQTDFSCADVGTNNLTMSAVDFSGNISSGSVVLTVVDTIAPTVITRSSKITLNTSGTTSLTVDSLNAGSWDSCGIASLTLSKSSFGCDDIGLNRVWLIATDVNGNTDSAVALVLVSDTLNFALNCIADTTLYTPSDSCSKTFSYDIISNATCGDSLTLDSGLLSGSAFPLGTTGVGIQKVEQSGEYELYDFDSLTTGSLNGQDGWLIVGNTNVNAPTVSNFPSGGLYPGGLGVNVPDLGANNRLWLTRKNNATWSLPSFDSTDVITIELDMNRNYWGNHFGIGYDANNDGDLDNNEFIIGFATSDVSNSIVIQGPGITSLASTALSYSDWMAVRLEVDLMTKTASLSYRELTTEGTWTSPAAMQNVAVAFDYTASNNTNPILADGMVYFHEAGGFSQFDNVLFSVKQREACSFNVTVEDSIPPNIVVQNLTIDLDSFGAASITVDSVDNGTNDNCTLDSIGIDIISFTCADVGSPVQVVFTAIDSVGNQDTAHVYITVEDNIAPEVLTQNNVLYLDASGIASITPAMVDNGTWDSCGIDSLYLDISTFGCADTGINTVTLNAEDVNGNTSSQTATVTVYDTISPTTIVQNDTVYLDINGSYTLLPSVIDNGSNDACGITQTIDTALFSCANIGSLVSVTLTSTDPSGNSSSAIAIVTVLDTVSPTVLTQNHTVYLDNNGEAGITVGNIDNGTWDNCSIDTLWLDIDSFSCSDVGTPVIVTLNATDINGNSASNTSTVTVFDTVNPSAIAQNRTIYLDSFGFAMIQSDSIDNGSNDACGLASLNLNDSIFDCSNVGSPFNIVLTATDVNGNTDTAIAQITVIDTIAPLIELTNATVYLDSFGMAGITPAYVNTGTWDSCGIASLNLDSSNFSCSSVGDTISTWFYATDINGNTDSALVDLYILDTIAPEVVTQNTTVYLDSFGKASITPAMVNNGSWDSCGIQNYSLDLDSFTCANIGSNTVTLTITDVNGNTNSNTADVNVLDTVSPHIIATSQVLALDSFGNLTITPSVVDNGTWDSCGITSLVLDSSNFSCSNAGQTFNIGLTATDVNGNVSVDSVEISIIDTIAPKIITQNITVYLDSTGNVLVSPAMVDNGTWDSCGIDNLS